MSRKSLAYRDREFPWMEVAGIEILSGTLFIDINKRRRLKIPTSQIPNIDIFLQLADEEIVIQEKI